MCVCTYFKSIVITLLTPATSNILAINLEGIGDLHRNTQNKGLAYSFHALHIWLGVNTLLYPSYSVLHMQNMV